MKAALHDTEEKQKIGKVTLDDCLELFLQEEKLSAEDPWYCPACAEFVQASKKFDLWKLPEVLIIQLKRFSYSRYWRDKLDTYVEFPLKGLDLTPFTQGEHKPTQLYDLFAISNHYGGLGGGHYTAFAKTKSTDEWYHFDDSSVSRVHQAGDVKTKAAYVLCYRRRPEVPPP